ncbi:ester cyclase [Haloferax namakaokahaiae]|uniref:Ester cyclase n=1 Tax=Haloferax namakaokahaiae TaxID=1748331 RepID=A0ABD5ZI29_9EURY
MAATRSVRENERIYRDFIEEVWNERDFDRIGEFIADECRFYDPSNTEPLYGPEEMRAYLETYDAAFPDAKIEVEDLIATEEWVAARWTATGTHEGSLMGIEPTGNDISVTALEMNRIVDGKIVEGWQVTDTLGMMQQLGVVEPFVE